MKPFKKNSKVVFIGDRITCANHFIAHIVNYYRILFPENRVLFSNAAIDNSDISICVKHLEEYVYTSNPDYAVIMYGLNDSDYIETSNNLKQGHQIDKFRFDLLMLINQLQSRGIPVILLTPPPCSNAHNYNIAYAEFMRSIAKSRSLHLADVHDYLSDDKILLQDYTNQFSVIHSGIAKCFLINQGIPKEMLNDIQLSENVMDWHKITVQLADIRFTETNIINNDIQSTQERLKIVQKYIGEQKYETPFFEQMAKKYLELKPIEHKLKNMAYLAINDIYDNQ